MTKIYSHDANPYGAAGPAAAVSRHAREGTPRSAWREPSSASPATIHNSCNVVVTIIYPNLFNCVNRIATGGALATKRWRVRPQIASQRFADESDALCGGEERVRRRAGFCEHRGIPQRQDPAPQYIIS